MLQRQGLTLMEMLVVLIIIAVVMAFTMPNFFTPTEQALATNAQNNLLAIYSAQKNYNNNNSNNLVLCPSGSLCYCSNANNTSSVACQTATDTTCGDTLTQLNCNLSLNIQNDNSYTYDCGATTAGWCTAQRTSVAPNGITVQLNHQIIAGTNPKCTLANSTWCP